MTRIVAADQAVPRHSDLFSILSQGVSISETESASFDDMIDVLSGDPLERIRVERTQRERSSMAIQVLLMVTISTLAMLVIVMMDFSLSWTFGSLIGWVLVLTQVVLLSSRRGHRSISKEEQRDRQKMIVGALGDLRYEVYGPAQEPETTHRQHAKLKAMLAEAKSFVEVKGSNGMGRIIGREENSVKSSIGASGTYFTRRMWPSGDRGAPLGVILIHPGDRRPTVSSAKPVKSRNDMEPRVKSKSSYSERIASLVSQNVGQLRAYADERDPEWIVLSTERIDDLSRAADRSERAERLGDLSHIQLLHEIAVSLVMAADSVVRKHADAGKIGTLALAAFLRDRYQQDVNLARDTVDTSAIEDVALSPVTERFLAELHRALAEASRSKEEIRQEEERAAKRAAEAMEEHARKQAEERQRAERVLAERKARHQAEIAAQRVRHRAEVAAQEAQFRAEEERAEQERKRRRAKLFEHAKAAGMSEQASEKVAERGVAGVKLITFGDGTRINIYSDNLIVTRVPAAPPVRPSLHGKNGRARR